ncbi:50S ribosomal protein L4 [Candidatus Pacearchaeota archaeon RBG_16_35_8]|nr:50S ribosomal protein L4P [uncultured archaeon]AJS13195.1 50S ribosomal protein L4P, large subunit ribosomal protein L4e [uncultured archaeon]OGJ12329.1 MAG: 50S ribosomal protein L4 [Candidatus Pacearchaeota archaeon RBG_16_35_8]
MKADILDISGKKTKTIELPSAFSKSVREDLIQRVVQTKKHKQPYAPYFMAGRQHSASGRIVHRRHVWRSGYGRGMSRIPRKTMSRRGSQFGWIGAEIPSAVGGRRAHPPIILSMLTRARINKKEMKVALESALSATANEKMMAKRYERLNNQKIEGLPFVVESKLVSLKTKELVSSLKKILGEKLFDVAIKIKSIRSGRGKRRGRKYKSSSGALIVLGKEEEMKAKIVDSRNVQNLSVADLADGKPGRLTIYTEKAIKDLGEKLEGKKK